MDKTFYPTEHMTLDKRYLYKHYFIGDERISTEVCRWDERQFTQPESRIILLDGNEREFAEKVIKQVKHAIAHVGYEDPFEFNRGDYSHPGQEKFFYHYTHQGSVAVLTDHHGEFYQHLQYLPYGDVFVDKRRGFFASPYTFSAKEKDSESGYNYFGARYYTDNIMMWLSVDPMSDKNASTSPYMYCAGNPIKYKDLYGMDTILVNLYGYFGKPKPDNSDKDTYVRVSRKEYDSNKINYNKKTGRLRWWHSKTRISKGIINIEMLNINGYCNTEKQGVNDEMEKLFKWLANSTKCEWAHDIWKKSGVDEYMNVLQTSHNEETVETTMRPDNPSYVPYLFTHSHPSGSFISEEDKKHYRYYQSMYPDVTFKARIYKDLDFHYYNGEGEY
jgi:RHS repeat-associated protein